EHCFNRAAVERRIGLGDEAVHLTPVAIALDPDVDQPERSLRRIIHVSRKHDSSRARAKDRSPAARKVDYWLSEILFIDELHHRCALAAGNDESVKVIKFRGAPDFDSIRADVFDRANMRVEVTLNRKHADRHRSTLVGETIVDSHHRRISFDESVLDVEAASIARARSIGFEFKPARAGFFCHALEMLEKAAAHTLSANGIGNHEFVDAEEICREPQLRSERNSREPDDITVRFSNESHHPRILKDGAKGLSEPSKREIGVCEFGNEFESGLRVRVVRRSYDHLHNHQPRVWSKSPSASLDTSSPRIASPSSSLASSTIFGSAKCVVAFTIARAREAGSDDLNIPDPTNTDSAPNCMHSEASAGVAI